MSRAVVFDVGRVLVEWHPERPYDAAFGRAHREAFFAAVDVFAMNAEIDLGGDPSGHVEIWARRHPRWAEEIRLWHSRWIEQVGPSIDATVDILHALRARGVPVFALTNFNDRSFAIAQARWPFLTAFDRAFVSGELRVMKPDPEIYARVEVGTGLAGEALFFTDDSPANVEAARSRGWATHLFEGAEGLLGRLEAEGFL